MKANISIYPKHKKPNEARYKPSFSSFLYGFHSKFLWTRFYNKARTKRKQKKEYFSKPSTTRDVGLLLFDIKASLAIQRRWKSSFLPRKYLRKKSSTRAQYTKMFLKSPILKIGKWLHQRITNHFVLLDVKPNVVVLYTNITKTLALKNSISGPWYLGNVILDNKQNQMSLPMWNAIHSHLKFDCVFFCFLSSLWSASKQPFIQKELIHMNG